MNFKQSLAFLVMLLFTTAAFSGDKNHHKMEIKVISDDGDGQTRLVLDSDELGFNLHDMQVGENQSIVDKDGRPVLITRTEDGFTFDVDGKSIEMPAFNGPHERNGWVSEVAPNSEVDVRVIRGGPGRHHGMAPHAMMETEGVMIISAKDIDAATQQVIRDALRAAGHESVNFAGGFGRELHEVQVVKKVVEVSDEL